TSFVNVTLLPVVGWADTDVLTSGIGNARARMPMPHRSFLTAISGSFSPRGGLLPWPATGGRATGPPMAPGMQGLCRAETGGKVSGRANVAEFFRVDANYSPMRVRSSSLSQNSEPVNKSYM